MGELETNLIRDAAAFVWVDIETTGLNPIRDRILEIGVMVTDKDGLMLGHNSWLVDHRVSALDMWDNLPDKVIEMHQASGLIDDWNANHQKIASVDADGSLAKLNQGAIESDIIRFLEVQMGLEDGKYGMAGSSVHFDRAFIKQDMPALHEWFHYRNVDISTIKQLCKQLNMPVALAWERESERLAKGHVRHRAIPDLAMTVAEYAFYKDNFLFVA